jgi:hypothetical protein
MLSVLKLYSIDKTYVVFVALTKVTVKCAPSWVVKLCNAEKSDVSEDYIASIFRGQE